jgi:hypothetical protein
LIDLSGDATTSGGFKLVFQHLSAAAAVANVRGECRLPWSHSTSVFKMMEVSRHKSVDTLHGCVWRADLLREHAGAAFL